MTTSLELQQRMAELRIKARQPDGLTIDEMREAIGFLREERLAMPPAKSRTVKVDTNVEDTLKELGL